MVLKKSLKHSKNRKKHTKNKRKKTKQKKRRLKFNDVPISDKVSLRTLATKGYYGDYHYQYYTNNYYFWDNYIKKNEKIREILCWPFNNKFDWSNFLLKVNLIDNTKINSSELVKINVEPLGFNKAWSNIANTIRNCEKRFFMMPIMLSHPNMDGSHANIILVDTEKSQKKIMLLEPHGKRRKLSTLDSVESGYFLSNRYLNKFFSKILPEYQYISPHLFMGSNSLQSRIDSGTGLCITWGILFVHYRLINLDKTIKQLINYLDKKITRKFILKYARFVEEIIKENNN